MANSNYVQSFRHLGYELPFNLDYAAFGDKGVCISLWRREIDRRGNAPFDTRLHADDTGLWKKGPTAKRTRLLCKAMVQHEGWVDAVVRDDRGGRKGAPSQPWNVAENGGLKWRLLDVTPEGHFVADLQRFPDD